MLNFLNAFCSFCSVRWETLLQIVVLLSSRLVINATNPSFSGVYTCTAVNRGGQIWKNFTFEYSKCFIISFHIMNSKLQYHLEGLSAGYINHRKQKGGIFSIQFYSPIFFNSPIIPGVNLTMF